MELQYEITAQTEHQLRQAAYRRALGDPEQAWLAQAERDRHWVAIDLRGLSRAASALMLALLRIF